jgi:hypothetical protein
MRLVSILLACAGMLSCNVEGEVDPDLECNTQCEEDRDVCEGDCDDLVECLDDCSNAYDDCTVSCDENDENDD